MSATKPQRSFKQSKPNVHIQTVSTKDLWAELKEIFLTKKIIAFQGYKCKCRIQKKNDKLEQFMQKQLAAKADCWDRKDK